MHRACGPSPRRHARVRPEAVASPNRGLGLAPRHPEEIVAGSLLALCAPSGRLGLAEPVEDFHDQGELPLEARIELIGVAQMILSYVGLKPSPSGLVDPVREFCHLTMSTGLMSHMRMSPKNGRSLL